MGKQREVGKRLDYWHGAPRQAYSSEGTLNGIYLTTAIKSYF